MSQPDRRQFLLQSATLAAASFLPANLFSQAALPAPERKIPNQDTMLKFNPDGTPRPFAGNTVICHLPAQSAMRDAMVELHDALKRAPYRHKLGLTSTDSYHMTIFPGANDQNRSAYGWPSYVPMDAPIEVCDRMVGERMAKTHFACPLPLRMRVDQERTLHYSTACTLRLIAVDDEEEKKLRSLRDKLAEVFGFQLKDHATYQFHMTMSYQLATFTSQEDGAYRELLGKYIPRIISAEPVLELGVPEYCVFPDMFRFEPEKLLACS